MAYTTQKLYDLKLVEDRDSEPYEKQPADTFEYDLGGLLDYLNRMQRALHLAWAAEESITRAYGCTCNCGCDRNVEDFDHQNPDCRIDDLEFEECCPRCKLIRALEETK